eukprot:augustus_masked-scaffold_1-processed-gene-25.61-mRNA-1 protein AED:1.00 eAED:1.00 QI:0/-1/0/0/-1/1/1/0/911
MESRCEINEDSLAQDSIDANNYLSLLQTDPSLSKAQSKYDEDTETERNLVELTNLEKNTLLEPIQQSIEQQLIDKRYQIECQIREEKEGLKRGKSERERVGITLYGLQQHLAQSQNHLKSMQKERDAMAVQRAAREKQTSNVKVMLQGVVEKFLRHQLDLEESTKELNSCRGTKFQVDKFKLAVQDEISLTKRQTYKSEDNIRDIETNKKYQDIRVIELEGEIKLFREQGELLKENIEWKNRQNLRVKEEVAAIQQNLDMAVSSAKEMALEWEATVKKIEHRNESRRMIEATIVETRDKVIVKKQDLSYSFNKIEEATTILEEIAAAKKKLAKETSRAEDKENALILSCERKKDEYKSLLNSIEVLEDISQKSQVRITLASKELKSVKKRDLEQKKKIFDCERSRTKYIAQKTTLDNESRSMLLKAMKIREEVFAKELLLAEAENDLSTIELEIEKQIVEKEEKEKSLRAVLFEVETKEDLASEYELQLRQLETELEKKLVGIDKINKQLQVIHENQAKLDDAAALGPLESTIHHLNLELTSTKNEIETLGNQWLNLQWELVDLNKQWNRKSIMVNELKSKILVLRQKEVRLESVVATSEMGLASIVKTYKHGHQETKRLNQLICESKSKYQSLLNKKKVTKKEVTKILSEFENCNAHLCGSLTDVEEENKKKQQNVLKLEKKVKELEKDILVEKKTQATINPKEGKDEVNKLKRQKFKLEKAIDCFKHQQQTIIKSMEKAVIRNGEMSLKAFNPQTSYKLNKRLNTIDIRKRINSSQTRLRQIHAKVSKVDKIITDNIDFADNVLVKLEQVKRDEKNATEKLKKACTESDEARFDRQILQNSVDSLSAAIEKYTQLSSNSERGFEVLNKPKNWEVNIDSNLVALREAVCSLEPDYPELKTQFQRFQRMLE